MIKAWRNKIRSLPSWVFWTGMAFTGILIIIFNDAFGEVDGFQIFAFFYFFFLMFSLLRWIVSQIKSILVLKRDKVKMEMLHLKSQVNPHFFFNTLNNLYGLLEKNPKEAQKLILKLSDLMRYSIYEGQNEWVTLEQEVAYLKNYVELHKNRYHKKVTVNFNATIHDHGYRIMPLLLILLVENAFKHGVEKLRNDAFVDIVLIAKGGKINFTITNNFDLEEDNDQSGGIGISNLKRRLEIGYKRKFDLSITKQDETFEAKLSLLNI